MTLRAVYQGTIGSYSHAALEKLFQARKLEAELEGQPSYQRVATAVVSGAADVGLLPLDSNIAGTVREGYDLLAQYDLVPLLELEERVDHHLLGLPGATVSDVREVLGHPLALAECGRFLGTLAAARAVPASDTGAAAAEVARSGDPKRTAIGSLETAKRHGLVSLAETIADHPEARTRFVLFAAPKAAAEVRALSVPGSRKKTSLVLATRHEHGALVNSLSILSNAGINLLKLESRPKLGKPGEHLFYVDLEGDDREPRIGEALAALRASALELRVIGSYDAAGGPTDVPRAPDTVCAPPRSADAPPAEMPASAAKNWPKASRPTRPKGTRVVVGGVEIGGDDFVVVAGPCSVESRAQVTETAKHVARFGARLFRGGAFKPRTNPYAFQGLGWEGVALLGEAGRAAGLPIVSEVMSIDQVERMAREVDMLQIGARNMQNFDLLRAVGKTDRPVLLKRGLSASLDELLAAAEYVLAEGNPNVVLCERGIRTFETATRNTLDLSAVPVLRERTHLPVMVDPSHGVGVRRWIRPLCRAAKAVGAHGILIEVHPNPEEAKSDKDQALTFEDFRTIMDDLGKTPWGAELEAAAP
ncbi:MAG TPA: 3-deoxy-7-phosphoheptulonate synthase [Polyangiaceae bacterium]|nr:3-deoxy-7-phosphoheptulonate synthase [Polyangiaceae bacterium]